jgi:mRNA interferase MazF
VVVAPLTSQIRGLTGEVPLGDVRWLPKPSAVNVQGVASFDPNRLDRRLGVCTSDQMHEVKKALRELFDL